MELIYAFLKTRMSVLYGPKWWRKPENLRKTTDIGRATNSLLNALDQMPQTAEATSLD